MSTIGDVLMGRAAAAVPREQHHSFKTVEKNMMQAGNKRGERAAEGQAFLPRGVVGFARLAGFSLLELTLPVLTCV